MDRNIVHICKWFLLIPCVCFANWTMPAHTNVQAWGTSITATGTVREHTQVVSHYESTNDVEVYTNLYWRFDDGASSNDYTETDGTTYTNLIVDVGIPDRTNTFILVGRDVAMWELYLSQLERSRALGVTNYSQPSFYWHADYVNNLQARKDWVTNYYQGSPPSFRWVIPSYIVSNRFSDSFWTTNSDYANTHLYELPIYEESSCSESWGYVTNFEAPQISTNHPFGTSTYYGVMYDEIPTFTSADQVVTSLVSGLTSSWNYLDYTPFWPSPRCATNSYTIIGSGTNIVTNDVWLCGVKTNFVGTNDQAYVVVFTNENIQVGFSGADYMSPEPLREIMDGFIYTWSYVSPTGSVGYSDYITSGALAYEGDENTNTVCNTSTWFSAYSNMINGVEDAATTTNVATWTTVTRAQYGFSAPPLAMSAYSGFGAQQDGVKPYFTSNTFDFAGLDISWDISCTTNGYTYTEAGWATTDPLTIPVFSLTQANSGEVNSLPVLCEYSEAEYPYRNIYIIREVAQSQVMAPKGARVPVESTLYVQERTNTLDISWKCSVRYIAVEENDFITTSCGDTLYSAWGYNGGRLSVSPSVSPYVTERPVFSVSEYETVLATATDTVVGFATPIGYTTNDLLTEIYSFSTNFPAGINDKSAVYEALSISSDLHYFPQKSMSARSLNCWQFTYGPTNAP